MSENDVKASTAELGPSIANIKVTCEDCEKTDVVGRDGPRAPFFNLVVLALCLQTLP